MPKLELIKMHSQGIDRLLQGGSQGAAMSAKTERKGINLTPRGSITDLTTYAHNYDDDLNLTIAIMS